MNGGGEGGGVQVHTMIRFSTNLYTDSKTTITMP